METIELALISQEDLLNGQRNPSEYKLVQFGGMLAPWQSWTIYKKYKGKRASKDCNCALTCIWHKVAIDCSNIKKT